jgi:hypothetical protein
MTTTTLARKMKHFIHHQAAVHGLPPRFPFLSKRMCSHRVLTVFHGEIGQEELGIIPNIDHKLTTRQTSVPYAPSFYLNQWLLYPLMLFTLDFT